MPGQTKIAVALGAILIAGGIWYVRSGEKQQDVVDATAQDAQDKAASDLRADEETQTHISLTEDHVLPSGTRTLVDTGGASSSDAASPTPRRIEDEAAGWRSTAEADRPEPSSTYEPIPAMKPTDLPAEREGLTSVLPNTGTPSLVQGPAAAGEDMPPNADKDALPELPELPPIEPVDIASTESTESTPPPSTLAGSRTGDDDRVPAKPTVAEQPVAEPAEPVRPREHVVEAGDTFSGISLKYYRSAKYVDQLMKANPGKDPRRLYVGTKLVIPDIPEANPARSKVDAAARPGGGSTLPPLRTTIAQRNQPDGFEVPPPDPARAYTVQPGEGWWDLAQRFMGDGRNYPELYEYNKERVGGDPHLLRAGTVIELPPHAKLPARASAEPQKR